MTDNRLYIQMLGGCSLRYGTHVVDDRTYRSKKLWTLLEYMIAFRDRQVSQEELINLIYPNEKSANPAGALKTLVYRIRNMLDDLQYVSSHDMILVSRGTYAWNNELDFELDVDRFEQLCHKADSPWTQPEERLNCCLSAAALYSGDFLPKSASEEWVVPFSIYYHSMYIRLVHTTVDLLEEAGRWEEVVSLCEQAIQVDAYEEFFYYHLILALSKTGRNQAALDQYKKMYDIFYTQIGVTPSPELTALYKEIIKTTRELESDLTVIQASLKSDDEGRGAFLCELEVFKDIYNLEVRSASRTGRPMFLCLITASDRHGGQPPLKQLQQYMSKLRVCILGSLRRGDIVAQYSIAQYILLLPTTTVENCQMVMERILNRFRDQHPRCPLQIEYSVQSMDVMP